MAYKGSKGPRDPFQTTEKLMQTFRMNRELVAFLKGEAARRGMDLTAFVTRVLEGLRNYHGLPAPAVRVLDEDREALGTDRVDYLLYVLNARSIDVRDKGPGFDARKLKGK
jgi:hypothetical protein